MKYKSKNLLLGGILFKKGEIGDIETLTFSELLDLDPYFSFYPELNHSTFKSFLMSKFPEKYYQLINEYEIKYSEMNLTAPKLDEFNLTKEKYDQLKTKGISAEYFAWENKHKRYWTSFLFITIVIGILLYIGMPPDKHTKNIFLLALIGAVPALMFAHILSDKLGLIWNWKSELTTDDKNYLKYIEHLEDFNNKKIKIVREFLQVELDEFNSNFKRERKIEEEKLEIKRKSLDYWQSLTTDGIGFEDAIEELFLKEGYKTERTPITGDEGIDIIVKKNGKKIAIQCKAHKDKLGPSVVRELLGSMVHCGADQAILATLNGTTESARSFIKEKIIRILTTDDYLNFIKIYLALFKIK